MSTTLNLQVGASADDAYEADDNTGFNSTGVLVVSIANTVAASRYNGGMRFSNVLIPQGATIISAVLEVYSIGTVNDDSAVDIFCNDVDNAVNFSTDPDVTSRVRTTATVSDNTDSVGTGWYAFPDISSVVQEVIDRAGWASGNAFVVLVDGQSTVNKDFRYRSYDGSAANAAKLTIVYTEQIAVIQHHRQQQGVC